MVGPELFLVPFFLLLPKRTFLRGFAALSLKHIESSQKRFRPLFCFPDHPIDYEGSFFLNEKQKGNNPYGKVAAVHGFFALFSKAHFPLTKRPFVVKKSFSLS